MQSALDKAIIRGPDVARVRVMYFIEEQAIITLKSKRLPSRIRTFCINGDEPTATALVRKVRKEQARRVDVLLLIEMNIRGKRNF